MRTSQPPRMSIHTCGLYFSVPLDGRLDKHYLPQVNIKAHAHILSTVSRTTITQTFTNPSSTKGIRSARYVFPLYDGVSVVGFECRIGDRLIIGEVKEKEKAKAEYSQAVDRGEVAALFEQIPDASDCFTTTVGNIPPDTQAVVTITYLGELKHDMEVDGIRYTIPTRIFPRYGPLPDLFREKKDFSALGMGISITVDAEVAAGSFIQKISSPSHPIAVTMGTTSLAPNDDHSPTKASASLSLDKTSLETDFVLQIVAKDSGIPRAILENHPTVSDHRALMATLVPKFALPSERPEVVFVCDRSGSMGGTRITLAIQALKVLLKSLPVGVKFNICSFGSRYSFLWEKSATYSQQTLDESMNHINSFAANYGGTELRQPLEATIANRYKDIPLEIIMLTDGEAWRQGALFAFLNEEITVKNSPIRIFPLGIGTGVSHAFIEGVARAGNGFSQAVGEGEKMDAKVVRMLKGALSPHINDYTLEIKYSEYSGLDSSDDGFELIEKVADALNVQLNLSEQGPKEKQTEPQKPISLFNQSADPDKEPTPPLSPTGQSKYSYLPNVAVPKIIQAPQKIPSLFAFNRTTVYLLLGPDAPQATPKSVILRGTSSYGPLELEIPIQMLESPDEMIHQLAAKKAIAELEQGRGWLPEARDKESGNLIKAQYESRFSDMVEREAVRLGVQFQVGGKWCSFVALEKKSAEESDEAMSEDYECLDDDAAETTRGEWRDVTFHFHDSSRVVESWF